MFKAIVSTVLAPVQPHLNVVRLGLTYVNYGRSLMERGEQPSGMAKGTLIVLAGFAIIAIAIFAALRAAGGKIQTQMNADY